MNIELKSCPFCGGRANLLVTPSGVAVRCRKCFIGTLYHLDDNNSSNVIREVVDEWNRRVTNGNGKP